MRIARWALLGAALLAAVQAWLWSSQQFRLLLVGAITLCTLILLVALRPGSRLAAVVHRRWALPRVPGESDRWYHLRIAGVWLSIGLVSVAALFVSVAAASSPWVSLVLLFTGFTALLMALQSLLSGSLRNELSKPPASTCERPPGP
jgi:hypothetical protein